MTYEELENKYADILRGCFDFSPPPGWYDIVDDLLGGLRVLDPKVRIDQVKEKFAELCVYFTCDENGDAADLMVLGATSLSRHRCQLCGNYSTGPERENGWWMTLCNEHLAEQRNK